MHSKKNKPLINSFKVLKRKKIYGTSSIKLKIYNIFQFLNKINKKNLEFESIVVSRNKL